MRKAKYTREELSTIANDLLSRLEAMGKARPLEYKERYDREELSDIANHLMDHMGDVMAVTGVGLSEDVEVPTIDPAFIKTVTLVPGQVITPNTIPYPAEPETFTIETEVPEGTEIQGPGTIRQLQKDGSWLEVEPVGEPEETLSDDDPGADPEDDGKIPLGGWGPFPLR